MNKQIDFVMKEMTVLRYYIPLIDEAVKRGYKCDIFIGKSNKYNCPSRFMDAVKELSNWHNFGLHELSKIKKRENITFFVESTGLEEQFINDKQKKFVVTYSGDFTDQHKLYENKVDYILMISEFFAKYYDVMSEKNLFFGSPKFDVVLNKNEILQKYNLKQNTKKALVVYPRHRDLSRINLEEIYSVLKKNDFELLVKTRGKDPIYNKQHKGDFYFEDDSWHPHTTMELMKVSDVVINFGSGAIKECVMLDTPVIDFHIKPFRRVFAPLFEYDYSAKFDANYDISDFEKALLFLTTKNLEDDFEAARKIYLYDKNYNSSKNIIDFIETF